MPRCSQCKKVMWPWQDKSNLNFEPYLHSKCHAKSLSKLIKKDKDIPLRMIVDLVNSNVYKYLDFKFPFWE